MRERAGAGAAREKVRGRARRRCEYCRTPEEPYCAIATFSVEHILARSRGGDDSLANLALSCHQCNLHKGDKTRGVDPVSGEEAPLFHPRRQRWDDHFAWSDDRSLLMGITATGRATIEELLLNRPRLVELRKKLALWGEHPAGL